MPTSMVNSKLASAALSELPSFRKAKRIISVWIKLYVFACVIQPEFTRLDCTAKIICEIGLCKYLGCHFTICHINFAEL